MQEEEVEEEAGEIWYSSALEGGNWLLNPVGTFLGLGAGAAVDAATDAATDAGTATGSAVAEVVSSPPIISGITQGITDILEDVATKATITAILFPLSLAASGLLVYTVLVDPNLPARTLKKWW